MATLFGYEVLFKAHHVDGLLYDLKSLLTSRSARKLAVSKSWKAEAVQVRSGKKVQKGIKGISEKGDQVNSYCFSFAFPKEPAFREFAKTWDAAPENGIGCVWTSLTIGESWGLLELTAAGSSISMLLNHELFQQQFIKQLRGVSDGIIFNLDAEGSKLIYPLAAPWHAIRYADEYRTDDELDVDLYANHAVKHINELRKR